jgi:hypothetical protein
MPVLPASLIARVARWRWLLASFALACQPIVAPTSEYGAYRAVHVAPTLPEQLRAAWAYLARYPDGAFHADVSHWFGRVEPLFYEGSADSAQGMQAYLDVLPQGPHAAAAAQRRDALIAVKRSQAGEGIAKAAAVFERRLARAAQSRENVIAAYSSWVARLADFDGWGRPLEPLDEPFASNWKADPQPACTASVCSKVDALAYQLEIEGQPETFVCVLDVAIRMKKGAVVEASVHGPALFSRVYEALSAEPVLDGDATTRKAAVDRLIEVTSGAVARKLDPHRCEAEPKPPAIMARQCDGIRLEFIPSSAANDDDRVVIRWFGKL